MKPHRNHNDDCINFYYRQCNQGLPHQWQLDWANKLFGMPLHGQWMSSLK